MRAIVDVVAQTLRDGSPPEHANAMIARGYRALVVGFDWSLLQRGSTSAIDGIHR